MRDLDDIVRQHALIYDDLAEEYETKAESREQRTSEIISKVSTFFKAEGHIIDVGCGVGVTTRALIERGFKVTAVDISPRMLSFTQKRSPEATCLLGDFVTIDFDNKFDGLLDFAFLHLFPKDVAVNILRKNNNILNTGGVLFIGTTCFAESHESWEEKKDYAKPFKRYRKHWDEQELKEALEETGFTVLDVSFNTDNFNKKWINFIAKKQ